MDLSRIYCIFFPCLIRIFHIAISLGCQTYTRLGNSDGSPGVKRALNYRDPRGDTWNLSFAPGLPPGWVSQLSPPAGLEVRPWTAEQSAEGKQWRSRLQLCAEWEGWERGPEFLREIFMWWHRGAVFMY